MTELILILFFSNEKNVKLNESTWKLRSKLIIKYRDNLITFILE